MYTKVTPKDVNEIVESHIENGKIVTKALAGENEHEEIRNRLPQIPFFSMQERIALHNCGIIDPENIDEYIALDGYQALAKVFEEMEPDEVVDEIKKSGLRGRGGGGFPTGRKWESSAVVRQHEKFVICNADEGDPGAFMDRSILEGDPHSVIEAMIINGYAVGAHQGSTCVLNCGSCTETGYRYKAGQGVRTAGQKHTGQRLRLRSGSKTRRRCVRMRRRQRPDDIHRRSQR